MRKKLLALLLAAALALSLLAGCGGGKALSQVIVDLLDNLYSNVSVEADSDLTAALKQAAAEGGTEEEILSRMIEILNHKGGSITFTRLGSGQQGDHAVTLYFQTGTDPDAAARNALAQWAGTLGTLPDDGSYQGDVAMIETENGYYIALDVEVLKAGKPSKPDKDDDEPETKPEPDKGYTETTDGNGNVTGYIVKNANGLMAWNDAVQKNLSLNCTLTKNITIDSNWTPIGLGWDGFTGTFDGGNHTITMEGIGTQVLFQYIAKSGGSTGTVKDLTIQVNGTISGSGNVGAVAMVNYGTIQNCHVTGGGTIQGSTYSSVGGIVGLNGGTIQGCSSAAAVKDGGSIGGIVGINRGTVTACYHAGTVQGSSNTGGVVGWNESGTVTACYHAGTVQGSSSSTGGVVGYNDVGTVNDCYWSGYNGNGIGLDTAGKYSSTTSLEHNKYFGSHNNMVGKTNVTPDWNAAMDAMNTAITANDPDCPYKWVANGDGLPTLTNQ